MIETCIFCRRELSAHESCECMMPIEGGNGKMFKPSDGLRARCYDFKARTSFRGIHCILCKRAPNGKMTFVSRKSRDDYYIDRCCQQYVECGYKKGDQHGDK